MNPVVNDGDLLIYQGDARTLLPLIDDESVNCVVTSPPYFKLRNYGVEGQIGAEDSVWEYVNGLLGVFAEIHRILTPDGSAWLNLGDSYTRSSGDLLGVPWMVALALQESGWTLRCDIIWHKPNSMPESVGNRPVRDHEYIFLLTKGMNYHYDAAAIAEKAVGERWGGKYAKGTSGYKNGSRMAEREGRQMLYDTRNKRSVWSVNTKGYKGAHCAPFPEELVETCILAGCPEGGTVLDPFMGSGTVAAVARRLGRKSVGIELNPKYVQLILERTNQLSLLADRKEA